MDISAYADPNFGVLKRPFYILLVPCILTTSFECKGYKRGSGIVNILNRNMEYCIAIYCISEFKLIILHIRIWNIYNNEDTATHYEPTRCGGFT